MSSKKNEKKEKETNQQEHNIEFNRPKSNNVASGDVRLNELIAQSHLSAIIKPKSGGYPASNG